MSILTTSVLKSAPSNALGVSISASGIWTYSSWVQVIASTANPIAIAGVEFSNLSGSYSNIPLEVDFGIGASGSEVSIGTLRLQLHNSGASVSIPTGVLFPVPLGGIGSGVRVSVRVRNNGGGQSPTNLTLNYYENLTSDHVTSSIQKLNSYPSGSASSIDITPSGTAWVNSAWVQVVASTAQNILLLGLSHYTNIGTDQGNDGIEYDIGTGASGSETVITTLREATPTGKIPYIWLPLPYPIVAGTRVSVRMRNSGTNTTVQPTVLLYLEDPVVATAQGRVSQLPVEVVVLDSTPVQLRLSQTAIEIVVAPVAATESRITQLVTELISLPTPDVRTSQVITELISLPTPSIRVSQLVTEILSANVAAPVVTEKRQFFIIGA